MRLVNFRKIGILTVVLCGLGLVITSCGDDMEDPDTCITTDLTYENYAKDFLAANCAFSGCHDANAIASVGNYTTYETTKEAFSFGRVKGAINHEAGFSNMPKGQEKLDDCSISQLSAWIDAGLPEG